VFVSRSVVDEVVFVSRLFDVLVAFAAVFVVGLVLVTTLFNA